MNTRHCTQCGQPFADERDRYCAACGAPAPLAGGPVSVTGAAESPIAVTAAEVAGAAPSAGRRAGEELAGRNCPYCRFPLKAAGTVHECPACHAVHHSECWQENGGCAIASCAAGPGAQPTAVLGAPVTATFATPPLAAAALAPPRPPVAAALAVPPPPPPPVARASGRRVSLGAVAMVAALVLALGGSATALVLTTKHANPSEQSTADVSGSDPASDTSSEAGTSDGSGTSGDTGSASDSGSDTSGTTGSDYGSDTSSTGGTDDSSGSNDSSSSYDDSSSASNSDTSTSASRASSASPETKVERAVRRHWRYIESGDYDAAFDLLAPSLQASSGGQASWVAQHEKDNLLSVDVSVTARDVSGSTAIVDVDTLRTDAEVTGCKDWSGYYEMVKTGGRWKIAKAKLAPSSC